MEKNKKTTAHLNIRDIPRDTLYRLKLVALIERQTMKSIVLELINEKFQELEKKGLIPKGK